MSSGDHGIEDFSASFACEACARDIAGSASDAPNPNMPTNADATRIFTTFFVSRIEGISLSDRVCFSQCNSHLQKVDSIIQNWPEWELPSSISSANLAT
jgi:hypothetical protein